MYEHFFYSTIDRSLSEAFARADEDAVIRYVEEGALLAPSKNYCQTPLHLACKTRMERAARVMIERGAPLDAQDPSGDTPLHLACRVRLESLALHMVSRGTPLHLRGMYGDYVLPLACLGHMEALALEMVMHGAPLGQVNGPSHGGDGNQPLHIACGNKLQTAAIAMIRKGAPLGVRNAHHQLPLDIAFSHELKGVAQALVEQGSPLELYRPGLFLKPHLSPLELAYQREWEPVVQAIIRRVPPKAQGKTPSAYYAQLANKNTTLRAYMLALWDHVMLPQLLGSPEATALVDAYSTPGPPIDALFAALCPTPDLTTPQVDDPLWQQHFFRPLRLLHSSHHPGVAFPRWLLPLKHREWYPLTAPVHVPNGCQVRCLTSTSALAAQTMQQHNCVGKQAYDAKCVEEGDQRSHILCISDAHGRPLSTAEVVVKPQEGPAPTGVSYLEIKQHTGDWNTPPSPEAIDALHIYANMIKHGEISPLSPLGETPHSRETRQRISTGLMSNSCGYIPTTERINRCFDEYRLPYRRASLPIDKHTLIYDDVPLPGGHRSKSHLIGGYALVDAQGNPLSPVQMHPHGLEPDISRNERIVDLRRLDALSWMRASGLLAAGREAMRKHNRDLGPLLAPYWEAQDRLPLTERPLPTPDYKIRASIKNRSARLDMESHRSSHPYFAG